MNLGTNLLGKFALFSISVFLVGCNDLKENDVNADDSKKLSVEFSQSEVSIPIGGSLDLLVNISPANRAGEVTFQVAEETVVSLDKQTPCEEGVMLHLSSHKLSSTTVYAFHEALTETPECVITVAPIGLESIALDKKTLSLKVFESATLSAKLTPENVTNPVLIWKSDNEEVVTVDNGVVTAHKTGEALVTVSFDGKSASCKVVVTAIPAESVTLWFDKQQVTEKEISEKESFRLDATILPEEVTYKTISEWSVSDPEILSCEAIYIDGTTLSAYITGKSAGKAKVYAKIELEDGGQPLVASCDVTVKALVPPLDPPKIGDYFYSDGTWSDGGLVSINSDGTGAVWLTGSEKPRPDPNKSVIGIVFSTDANRISEEEKALGFTHGLVFSLKAAFAPISTDPKADHKLDSLTRYALSTADLSPVRITPHRLTEACYNDIWGYSWNKEILSVFPKATEKIKLVPAFDWVNTDFSPAAPTNTSGWYVPSSGQIWDLVANLCGDEVAERLAAAKLGNVDLYRVDQYFEDLTKFSFNPVERLNSFWALVPNEMKHNLKYSRHRGSQNVCELMSSSLYVKGDDFQSIMFWLADDGSIYPYPAPVDDSIVCHPVLSF